MITLGRNVIRRVCREEIGMKHVVVLATKLRNNQKSSCDSMVKTVGMISGMTSV